MYALSEGQPLEDNKYPRADPLNSVYSALLRRCTQITRKLSEAGLGFSGAGAAQGADRLLSGGACLKSLYRGDVTATALLVHT